MRLSEYSNIDSFLDAAIQMHAKSPHRSEDVDRTFFGAVAREAIPGLVLEFGVATGYTFNCIADSFPDQTVYGFDWFQAYQKIGALIISRDTLHVMYLQ